VFHFKQGGAGAQDAMKEVLAEFDAADDPLNPDAWS